MTQTLARVDAQGADFIVNATLPGLQQMPRVAALKSGKFVTAWTANDSDGANSFPHDIAAQLIGRDGQKIGPQIHVNTVTSGNQEQPMVAALAGGGFVVTWMSPGVGGARAQVFDDNGNKVGNEIIGNNGASEAALFTDVTGLADGGFALVWEARLSTLANSDGEWGVRLQLFNADGSARGAAVRADPPAPPGGSSMMSGDRPGVASLAGGGIVVAWTDDHSGTKLVKLQLFTAAVAPVGDPFSAGPGGTPHLVALTGGGFVLNLNNSVAQVYDSAGHVVGGPISAVDVAALPGDQFAALDNSGASSVHVYDGAGGSLGPASAPFAVEGVGRLAANSAGDLLISWTHFNANDSANEGDVYAQMAVLGQHGTAGDDDIAGTANPDLLYGEEGNDVIAGGGGNDRIDGGAGTDIADFVLPSGTEGVLRIVPGVTGDVRNFTVEQLITTSGPGFIGTDFNTIFRVDFSGDSVLVTGFGAAADLGTDTLTGIEALRFSIAGAPGPPLEASSLAVTVGGPGGDNLVGTDARDVIDGSGGNDQLDGLGGSDTLLGGDGDDVLLAGTGIDRLVGGAGDDILYLGADYSFDDVIDGGDGTDALVLKGGFGLAWGGGTTPFTSVEKLVLLPGENSSYGGPVAGETHFDIQFSTDNAVGAGGTFTVDGSALTTALRFIGVGETDGRFVVLGGAAADNLTGGGGADVIDGGGLGDQMAGGLGDDTYYADSAADVVTEAQGAGFDTVISSAAAFTLAANVEKLVLAGAAVSGTGNGLANTLLGNAQNNDLSGLGGDDTIDGGAGADTMHGGAGNDTYYVDSSGDVVDELPGEGTDTIRTALGTVGATYIIPAEVENLIGTSGSGQSVAGNALGNVVTLGAGNDVLDLSQGGNDEAHGGGGNDYLYFGGAFTAADTVDGGTGNDTLALLGTTALTLGANTLSGVEVLTLLSGTAAGGSSHVTYSLTMNDGNVAAGGVLNVFGGNLLSDETLLFNGLAENDGTFLVYGGAAADALVGGQRNDSLIGGGGNDQLYGMGGNDWLEGGAGADQLRGGFGSDLFVYKSASDSTAAASDHIVDFEDQVDLINLQAVDANTSLGGDQAFTFIGTDAFSHTAGELRIEGSGSNWFVQGDVDGDGTADLVIQVDTFRGYALQATNFML
jgi:Ca2+-binding RTX toxin-like protein